MSMRKVYRSVAKKYGISVAEVKREINAAIDEAYKDNNDTLAMPTVDEFIAHCANIVAPNPAKIKELNQRSKVWA